MSHPSLRETEHRPWPLPRRPWAMAMQWHDLVFMHWPVSQDALAAALPGGLELDLFEGEAWLGVVPFTMKGVRPRGLPALPGPSSFEELNVRTYVVADAKPGVWFFSLDAASRVAVRIARRFFHLPYFDARMSCVLEGDEVLYRSERIHRGSPPALFSARYRGLGPARASSPSSLEHWLTERYCLYAARADGRIYRGDIHHTPWRLQRAEVDVEAMDVMRIVGAELPDAAPRLHFAKRMDVVAWLPRSLG